MYTDRGMYTDPSNPYFRVDLDRFEQWVRSLDDKALVGHPHSPETCPIAYYLRSREVGPISVYVGSSSATVSGPVGTRLIHLTPEIRTFVAIVDAKKRALSKRTTLRCLKEVRATYKLPNFPRSTKKRPATTTPSKKG